VVVLSSYVPVWSIFQSLVSHTFSNTLNFKSQYLIFPTYIQVLILACMHFVVLFASPLIL